MPEEDLRVEDTTYPDEETRKLVEDIQKEQKEETPPEAPKEEQQEAPEKAPEEPAPEPEPAKQEEEVQLDFGDEEPAEEESEEPEKAPEQEPRPAPAWQVKKLENQIRHEIRELREEILNSRKAPTAAEAPSIDAKLDQFAQKYSWDKQMLSDMKEALAPDQPQLPSEVLQAAKEMRRQAMIAKQEKGFRDELSETLQVLPDAKDLNVAKLKEIAFSRDTGFRPDGSPRSLAELILRNRETLIPREPRKTFESSRGGTSQTDAGIDLTKEQSPEAVAKMSDQEFEEYSENLAKQTRPTITRQGRTFTG